MILSLWLVFHALVLGIHFLQGIKHYSYHDQWPEGLDSRIPSRPRRRFQEHTVVRPAPIVN